MSGLAICIGPGAAVRGGAGAPPPVLSVTGTADGEIEIDAGSGALTVTITAPAHHAGTYTTDIAGNVLGAAQMAAGPQCLVAPRIRVIDDADASGTIDAGDTVGVGSTPDATSHPGLWIYDTANGAPAITWHWQADDGGDGIFADIPASGATAFVITEAEANDDVRLVETAADSGGARSAASQALSVTAAAPATSFAFTGHGDSGLGGASGAGPFTVAGLSFGIENPGREIWAVVAVPSHIPSAPGITGVTIGGIAAVRVAGTTAPSGYGYTEIWKAAVPVGTEGDVSVTAGGNAYGALVALYRGIGKRATATPASEGTAAAATVAADIATAAGDTVLTAAWTFNGAGLSLAGVAPDFTAYDFRSGDFFVTGTHEAAATETPRAVSATSPVAATVFNILSITVEDDA